MKFIKEWSGVVALVILAIMGLMNFTSSSQVSQFGSVACDQTTCLAGGFRVTSGVLEADGGFQMGSNGTSLNAIVAGGCTIWASATTIGATSSAQVVCQGATNGGISALTGVTSDAICNVTHASSTNTTSGGLVVAGVSASSTAGTIVAQVSNFTGAVFTWSAAASSSSQWAYSCFDPT